MCPPHDDSRILLNSTFTSEYITKTMWQTCKHLCSHAFCHFNYNHWSVGFSFIIGSSWVVFFGCGHTSHNIFQNITYKHKTLNSVFSYSSFKSLHSLPLTASNKQMSSFFPIQRKCHKFANNLTNYLKNTEN